MRHSEEIDQINEILNSIRRDKDGLFKNCPTSRDDEELTEGVTYLRSSFTHLPCDIIVDSGKTYEWYHHPLCLFVVDGDNVVPVTIERQPRIMDGCKVPPEVLSFIMDNYDTLVKFGNLKMSGGVFFDKLRAYNATREASRLIGEMTTYSPKQTGLPIWIYVDDTESYMRSGHSNSYRIKFQQDKSLKNPRFWMPVTIPGLQIMGSKSIPPCKIPQRDVNKVLLWAEGNKDLLLGLKNKDVSSDEFLSKMKTYPNIKVLLDSKCKEK